MFIGWELQEPLQGDVRLQEASHAQGHLLSAHAQIHDAA